MSEPTYCSIRRHYCACETRCDDWPSLPPAGRYMRPTMTCKRCKTETELYGSHPTCRECMETVCEACGVADTFNPERNAITCNRCATEAAQS